MAIPVLWKGNNRLPLEHSCYRDNKSPPVIWNNIPDRAKSLALFMDRVGDGKPYTYWTLFNIPASGTGLPAALREEVQLKNGGRFGRNDHGVVQYTGPCEPKGEIAYVLRLYALDEVLDLKPGAARRDIESAMENHIIDWAEQPFVHYKRM